MDELRKFAESSSMKGVPRMMKAKSLPIRLLWLVSVVGLFFVCLFLSLNLVINYLEKPKVIKIKDINALGEEYFDYPELFSLPDVTVCNQNPLTSYRDYAGTKWHDYVTMLTPLLSANNSKDTMFTYLSATGYLEHLGPKAVVDNRGKHDFVNDCDLSILFHNKRYPCGPALELHHFPSVLYSQCYTVRLSETYDYRATAISLTVYLDDVNAEMGGYDKRGSRGAAVLIHGPGQMPYIEEAYFAAAGQLTTFTVQQDLYERTHDEHEPCWQPDAVTEIHDLAGTPYNYTLVSCMQTVSQQVMQEACGCISSDWPLLPDNYTATELHFCGALSDNVTQMVAEMDCISSQSDKAVELAVASCSPLCREITRSVSVSSSPWPAHSAQLAFYADVIQHESFAGYFDAYDRIYTEFLKTTDADKAMAELAESSLLERNFAKVEIRLPAVRGTLYSESYQMTLAVLFAGIGGNLNMWCGISTVIIIEVLDLVLKLLLTWSKQPTRTTVTAFKSSDTQK